MRAPAVLALVLLAGGVRAEGVREERPVIAHLELFGRAALFSFGLELYFGERLGIGAGIGALPCMEGHFALESAIFPHDEKQHFCTDAVTMIPMFVSFNPFGDVHSLYLSGGAVLGLRSGGDFVLPVFQLGYQLQSQGGFVLRPAIQFYLVRDSAGPTQSEGVSLAPWFGITLGAAL